MTEKIIDGATLCKVAIRNDNSQMMVDGVSEIGKGLKEMALQGSGKIQEKLEEGIHGIAEGAQSLKDTVQEGARRLARIVKPEAISKARSGNCPTFFSQKNTIYILATEAELANFENAEVEILIQPTETDFEFELNKLQEIARAGALATTLDNNYFDSWTSSMNTLIKDGFGKRENEPMFMGLMNDMYAKINEVMGRLDPNAEKLAWTEADMEAVRLVKDVPPRKLMMRLVFQEIRRHLKIIRSYGVAVNDGTGRIEVV